MVSLTGARVLMVLLYRLAVPRAGDRLLWRAGVASYRTERCICHCSEHLRVSLPLGGPLRLTFPRFGCLIGGVGSKITASLFIKGTNPGINVSCLLYRPPARLEDGTEASRARRS